MLADEVVNAIVSLFAAPKRNETMSKVQSVSHIAGGYRERESGADWLSEDVPAPCHLMLSLGPPTPACQKRSTIILYCGCINTSGGGRGGAMEEKVIA